MSENDVKKDAPAVQEQDAPIVSTDMSTDEIASLMSMFPADSIAQANENVKQFRTGKATKVLSVHAKVNTLALKFYDEQLPYGERAFIDAIHKTDKGFAQVMAIKHYRDNVTNGIWAIAAVKPHWHVIVRFVDSKRRKRVSDILKELGVVFRRGVDDELWLNHGVETIGNFAGYAMYLTHETEDAIRDAKELYDTAEIVSNLTPEEIKEVRNGYIRVGSKHKLGHDDLVALDAQAYALGYELKSFDEWYNEQPFVVRSHAKVRVIRESYERGVDARIEAHDEILRTCIFVEGAPNTGKTYAAVHAFDKGGKHVYPVKGGGTGKFDRLRPDHDVIVVDDETIPNLLNMTDNYICRPYKRQKDNPPWTGEYLVITSNLSFDDWCESCGLRVREPYNWNILTKHGIAMHTRFFICRLEQDANGKNRLALTSPSTRGTPQEQIERADRFMAFKREFDAIIAQYTPTMQTVDFSRIIEPLK